MAAFVTGAVQLEFVPKLIDRASLLTMSSNLDVLSPFCSTLTIRILLSRNESSKVALEVERNSQFFCKGPFSPHWMVVRVNPVGKDCHCDFVQI